MGWNQQKWRTCFGLTLFWPILWTHWNTILFERQISRGNLDVNWTPNLRHVAVENMFKTWAAQVDEDLTPFWTQAVPSGIYGSLPTYRSFTMSSLLNIVIFHSCVKYVKLPEGNRPCNSPLVCLVRTLLCFRHVNISKSFRVRLLKKTSTFSKTLNLQQSG